MPSKSGSSTVSRDDPTPAQMSALPREIYTKALSAIEDGVCVISQDGEIFEANPAFARNHGYDCADELIGQNLAMLFDGPDEKHTSRQNWLQEYILPLLDKQDQWQGSTEGVKKDGSLFQQEIKISRAENGFFLLVSRDITERIKSEYISRTRLAAIEAAGDGIGIVDENDILIYVNKALKEIHGISEDNEDQFVGRHWENMYPKKGRKHIKNHVMPVFEREGIWRGESPLLKVDGTVIQAELSLTKLPRGGMIGTIRDITEKKKNEEERAQLKDQFYQAQKMEAIGRLAGGIAHDFNNILAAMMGYSEFLLEDLDADSKEREYAKYIYSAGLQARDLVDHMLAFSRRSERSYDTIDLTDPLQETLKMLDASLPKTIELHSAVEARHPFINGNAGQIGQVLMNLCVNSKDAIEDDHGVMEIKMKDWDPDDKLITPLLSDSPTSPSDVSAPKIKLIDKDKIRLYVGQLARGKKYIKLQISDTGSGISKQVAEHIFEPFYTTKSVNEGTGLGMSMVHGVIIEHQGAIFMESEVNKGTRFELFFPITEELENTGDIEEEDIRIEGQGRILIVEDQDNVRTMLKNMLERLGYDVTATEGPEQALTQLDEQAAGAYRLVISDQAMPQLTGIELARIVADKDPDLPFILISGYSKRQLGNASELSSNIKGTLRKPLKSSALSKLISEILDRDESEETSNIEH